MAPAPASTSFGVQPRYLPEKVLVPSWKSPTDDEIDHGACELRVSETVIGLICPDASK